MKLFCGLVVCLSFLSTMSLNANADDSSATVLSLAHKASFNGCDGAIVKEFEGYINSDSGRISSDYFNKNGQTFSLMATFGSQGDSVFIRTVFEKDGETCKAYRTTIVSSSDNCMAYKEKNLAWKYVEATGDYMWTKNAGGVDALMQTTKGGYCNIIFNIAKNYPAN